MDSLLGLPGKLFSEVVGCWLECEDIVRLSAACDFSYFQDLLQGLLRSKDFVLHSAVDISNSHIAYWLTKHEVKVSSIEFIVVPKYNSVAEYLRKWGPWIRTVQCSTGLDEVTTLLLATYCKYIRSVHWTGGSLPCTFKDVLISCSQIKDLRLSNIPGADHLFEGLQLPNLRTMSIHNVATIGSYFPWSKTAFSNSLTAVDLDSVSLNALNLLALAENCPQLKAFRLHGSSLPDSVWVAFFQRRPTLLHVDISRSYKITDYGLCSVLQALTQLKSINIQHCPLLTEDCIAHLGALKGDTLESIFMDVRTPDETSTEQIVAYFSAECVRLQYLNISCAGQSLDKRTCAFSLVQNCHMLRTLVVSDDSVIGATARGLMQVIRPNLRICAHGYHTKYNIFDVLV